MLQYLYSLHTVECTVLFQLRVKVGSGEELTASERLFDATPPQVPVLGSTFMGCRPATKRVNKSSGKTSSVFLSTPRSTLPGIAAYAALWLNWNEIQYLPFLRPGILFYILFQHSVDIPSLSIALCAPRAEFVSRIIAIPVSARTSSWPSPDSSHGSHRRDRETRIEPSSSTLGETRTLPRL